MGLARVFPIWGSHELLEVPSSPISINLVYSLVCWLCEKGDSEWYVRNGAAGEKEMGAAALATDTG